MIRFPINNLQTASQNWREAVENSINSLELQVTQGQKNNDSRDKSMKTSIDAVSSALVRVKTLANADHKRYYFNGGSTPTRTPVLTFARPSWAKSATILATATVDVTTTYSGGSGNLVYGTLRMFIDGEQTTYSAYDFGSGGGAYTDVNQKTLSIEAPFEGSMTGTVAVSHSGGQNVTENTISIWPSFANTTSNEIPPIDGSDPWWEYESGTDPELTNQQVWDVGLNAANSCSLEIVATVFWNADPI